MKIQEKDDQVEEQRMVMERIIVLIRYIFSIGQSQMDGKVGLVKRNVFVFFTLKILVFFL